VTAAQNAVPPSALQRNLNTIDAYSIRREVLLPCAHCNGEGGRATRYTWIPCFRCGGYGIQLPVTVTKKAPSHA